MEALSLVNVVSDIVDGSFMPSAGVTLKVWSGVGVRGGRHIPGGRDDAYKAQSAAGFVCSHFFLERGMMWCVSAFERKILLSWIPAGFTEGLGVKVV